MYGKLLKYNFEDMYKCASYYKTNQHGVVQLFSYMYNRDWQKFFEHDRKKLLDTTRWCNYMLNVEDFINSDLSIMDRAIIIKIASYREFANWNLYSDNSIKIERIKDIPIERIEEISLINIEDNKIKLTFED